MQNGSTEATERRPVPAAWWVGLGTGILLVPGALWTDGALAAALRSDALPWLVGIMQWVTWLGHGVVDISAPIIIGVTSRAVGDRRGGRRGLLGGLAVALAGLLDQAVKNLLCRARPGAGHAGEFLVGFPCFPVSYPVASFPSGHATTAFALATVLSLWYPRWTAAWLLLAAVVGWSRIILGSHFPSDVLAGALLGVAVVLGFARWWPKMLAGTENPPAPFNKGGNGEI